MSHYDREICPECGSEDTVLDAFDVHECLNCGEFFEGLEYDRAPKQIRVKKPFREGKDDGVRER